jgi:DAPG hydrolase PhiG domain
MRPPAARPKKGRSLGWSEVDLKSYGYAPFWNPTMQAIPSHAVAALSNGALNPSLLPVKDLAIKEITKSKTQNGFAITSDGSMHINLETQMPGVTPQMIDWWFGWHSDSPERYKLWHPKAHVHAQWQDLPPSRTAGRSRYVGFTSIVDEFIGTQMLRARIQFQAPSAIGLIDASVEGGIDATAICARVGLDEIPMDMGFLAHHIEVIPGGSLMRSRFWIGPQYFSARKSFFRPMIPVLRKLITLKQEDARDLLEHCAQEMNHLATFLPDLYRQESGQFSQIDS